MNNDLISREALIKWIDDSVSQYGHTYSTDMLNMWGLFKDYLINNVPTVTPDKIQAIMSDYLIYRCEPERPQGEHKTACNVLLSLEQIVRKSDGWEDSAVEAVHNAVQTAMKCMHERPQGKWIKWNFKTFGAMGDWEYKCSNCEKVYGGEYNFCPNCGADMRGDNNE